MYREVNENNILCILKQVSGLGMKKTIMIIGAGLLQAPIINTAKKMDLQVIATDYNPNAIGLKDADIPIVMSTKDIEGSVRVAKQQNEITPISGVLTVGTDASQTVAAVANALNLPGIKFEDAVSATNKLKMRERFKKHGVPSPEFFPIWSLTEAKNACKHLPFPVVIKPTDNMGARGVSRVNSLEELESAFTLAKKASTSGELIIEEYMEGPELSIDALVYNSTIRITGVADRIIEYPPYFVETGHTMPSQLPIEEQTKACDVMKAGIKALGITIGAAKGDIKITPKGPMIGELAARLSGGFMSAYTYPYSTGVNLMKAMIEVAMGNEPENIEPTKNKVCIERAIITKPGIVKSITGLEDALQIKEINNIFLNVKSGDKVVIPKSNVEKAGNIIATADTLIDAEKAVEECKMALKIDIIEESEVSLPKIYQAAREKLKKVCYVCKVCDGKDCPNGVPGMGGVGTGASFRRNITALKKFKVKTQLIHDVTNPHTDTTFMGIPLAMPILAAPITGSVTNLGGAIDELEYNRAVVKGCSSRGTLALVGDGATPDKYKIGLNALNEYDGKGIPIFKPRSDNTEIIKRIKAAEAVGAAAAGMDIDAVVFKTMALRNQAVAPKSKSELTEIISSTNLPFVLKGIMNPRDAAAAVEAGAKGIIISNHGGRVLDEMPGSIEVLEEIVQAVNGEIDIAIDGGFRSGVSILKALALGAKIVMIGRPIAIAAVGMADKGVSYYLNHLNDELKKVMILTGSATLTDIKDELILRV